MLGTILREAFPFPVLSTSKRTTCPGAGRRLPGWSLERETGSNEVSLSHSGFKSYKSVVRRAAMFVVNIDADSEGVKCRSSSRGCRWNLYWKSQRQNSVTEFAIGLSIHLQKESLWSDSKLHLTEHVSKMTKGSQQLELIDGDLMTSKDFHCPLFHYVAIRSLATQYLDFHSMIQAVFCKVVRNI
ncbi:unnamed protein product [Cyprideis torosa]|uniref:Uncharacterized protein n=1 Tax=Cyprideis torosa TaxID=163714 RepID=A0A7R8WLE9_9CRUS|nr:unnamed protein product [Cyprideis torosa]CAG0904249.1 unnamed protein product [Cyprideis torosa]